MHELLNTLYVTTQGAMLRLDHDTVRVIVEDETRARLPLVRLQAIVVFGRVTITTPLIHRWRRGRARRRLAHPSWPVPRAPHRTHARQRPAPQGATRGAR